MIGNTLGGLICMAVIATGVFAVLFCLACAASAKRNGEAPGFFVLGALFCLFLIGTILLISIIAA